MTIKMMRNTYKSLLMIGIKKTKALRIVWGYRHLPTYSYNNVSDLKKYGIIINE